MTASRAVPTPLRLLATLATAISLALRAGVVVLMLPRLTAGTGREAAA